MFFALLRFYFILSISLWPFGTGRPGAEIKKTSLDLPANLEDLKFVRISLGNNASAISCAISGSYEIDDVEGRLLIKGARLDSTRIHPTASGIQFGQRHFNLQSIRLVSNAGIRIVDKTYRNAVTLTRINETQLRIVNELPIDDYLKGVLPWEANPSWSSESLKAQAVASRTYALFKAIENQNEPYDMSHGVLSQVYKGKGIEHQATDRAIEATRGEILTYNGKIFPGYFHSTCGGSTTQAQYIWDVKSHPALRGTQCGFCQESKHYRWSTEISEKEIAAKLNQKGIRLNEIYAINPDDLDESGRARSFVIEHDGGKVKVHSNDFRLWFDPAKVKSTLIQSISHDGDTFHFKGRGWGHGVGLCQYGMKRLGELGYSYHEILEYYYPGAQIKNISNWNAVPQPVSTKKSSPLEYLEDLLDF